MTSVVGGFTKTDWTEGGSPAFFNSKIMRELFVKVICQKQSIYNIEVVVHLNVDGKWILSQGCDKQMKCTNDLGKGT